MIRWYLMPVEEVSVPGGLLSRPEAIPAGVAHGYMIAGENWAIGWMDNDAAQHATYNALTGVRFLTSDLESNLGGAAVTAVVNALDARNLPSFWVNTSLTWHEVIKRVACYVWIMQRYRGIRGTSFIPGSVFDATVSSLPPAAIQALYEVRRTLNDAIPGLNLSVIAPGDTIGDLLQRWSTQRMAFPLRIRGVVL